jgi:hypothetical protein
VLGILAVGSTKDTPGPISDTFIGKIKRYFPSLYFSLSLWERDLLDSYFSSLSAPPQVVVSRTLGTIEPGGTSNVPNRTPLSLVSLDTSVSLPEEPSLTATMARPDNDSQTFCQPVGEQVLENMITFLVQPIGRPLVLFPY